MSLHTRLLDLRFQYYIIQVIVSLTIERWTGIINAGEDEVMLSPKV